MPFAVWLESMNHVSQKFNCYTKGSDTFLLVCIEIIHRHRLQLFGAGCPILPYQVRSLLILPGFKK